MPTVYIPSPLRRVTGGQSKVQVTGRALEAVLSNLERQYPDKNKHQRVRIDPLISHYVSDVRRALWTLLGAVGVVLLIACTNVANLLLSRTAARQKEMALRAALGADRVRIARQLLTESVVLAACGAGLGLFLAQASLPVLSALRQRYPDAHISWVVNRSYAELLRGHPDLDAVLPFDRGASQCGWVTAVRNYGQFFAGLRQQRFDLVIDLQGLFRSGLMTACSGAARRVGLSSAREGAFGSISRSRARTVIEAWADRTAALSSLPGIAQVYIGDTRPPHPPALTGEPVRTPS